MFFRLQVLKPGMMHRRQSDDVPALAAVSLDAVRRTEDSPADDSDDPIEQPDKKQEKSTEDEGSLAPTQRGRELRLQGLGGDRGRGRGPMGEARVSMASAG
jgi:hypothetical protein